MLPFEAESNGSKFSLRGSKTRTLKVDLTKPFSESENVNTKDELTHPFASIDVTLLQHNILYYISGFIIRKIVDKIDC